MSTSSPEAAPGDRPHPTPTATASASATGSWSTCTCTRNWSHDCSIHPRALIDHAEEEGLGAIAVTDHNVFAGALETIELARDRDLIVIPGEEVKTDSQGEVIGLFLREEIPRGMSFADTIEAIREQDGIVYVPHPFDRMHAIPSRPRSFGTYRTSTCSRSTTHACCSRPTTTRPFASSASTGSSRAPAPTRTSSRASAPGALRMRRFDGPEEFLLSLRTAEVLRRPKSLAYLQSLKWAAQVKEKVR